ncbi:MAG: DUF4115 domain-containing protein [Thalassospira sp.]|jgi:cytoskeleton protein RodZ|nr:DUF4115 domain-containing protein [Thalassospira sp.]
MEPALKIVDGTKPEPTVAQILVKGRKERGLSAAQVGTALNIRIDYIDAIEAGEYSSLPGNSYVIGFVRAYADYLDLKPDEVVAKLREEQTAVNTPKVHVPAPSEKAPKSSNSGLVFIALAGIVGALAYAGSHNTNDGSQAPAIAQLAPAPVATTEAAEIAASEPLAAQTAPMQPQAEAVAVTAPVQDAGQAAPASAPELSPLNAAPTLNTSPATDAAPAAVAPDESILLRAQSRLRFVLKDSSGKILTDATLEPGRMYEIKPKPGLSLMLSNPSAALFEINGETLPPLTGKTSRTLRNVTPASLRLLAVPAVPVEE